MQKLIHSWLLIWTFMKLSKNAKGLSYLSIKLKLNLEIVRSFKE